MSSNTRLIIVLNSGKEISPSPLASASYMIAFQTFSSMFLPTPRTSLSSLAEMEPPPSLSKRLKASYSLSSVNRSLLSVVAVTHSEYSISPLPSASASFIIRSTSSSARSPYSYLYPSRSSCLVNFPSEFLSRARKAF